MRNFLTACLVTLAPAVTYGQNCPGGQCPVSRPAPQAVAVSYYQTYSKPGYFFDFRGQTYYADSASNGVVFTHQGVQYYAPPVPRG